MKGGAAMSEARLTPEERREMQAYCDAMGCQPSDDLPRALAEISTLEKERDALEAEYHAVRAAAREGLSDAENVQAAITIDKVRLIRSQRDAALKDKADLLEALKLWRWHQPFCNGGTGQARGDECTCGVASAAALIERMTPAKEGEPNGRTQGSEKNTN
jgi:hypothetical protein